MKGSASDHEMWTLCVGHEDLQHLNGLRSNHLANGLSLFVASCGTSVEAGFLLN